MENIKLAVVNSPKPSHESGMLEREVQSLNILLALVNAPKPAHEAGMLERRGQPLNIAVALVNASKPAHEAGIPRKLVQRENKAEVLVYVLDVPQDSTQRVRRPRLVLMRAMSLMVCFFHGFSPLPLRGLLILSFTIINITLFSIFG